MTDALTHWWKRAKRAEAAQKAMIEMQDAIDFHIEFAGECLGCGEELEGLSQFVPKEKFPHYEDCKYVAWEALQ